MPRDIFRLAYNVHMEAENSDTAEVMLYGEIVEDGPKWWKWSDEDKSSALKGCAPARRQILPPCRGHTSPLPREANT